MFTRAKARDSSIMNSMSRNSDEEDENFIDFTNLDNDHIEKKRLNISFKFKILF